MHDFRSDGSFICEVFLSSMIVITYCPQEPNFPESRQTLPKTFTGSAQIFPWRCFPRMPFPRCHLPDAFSDLRFSIWARLLLNPCTRCFPRHAASWMLLREIIPTCFRVLPDALSHVPSPHRTLRALAPNRDVRRIIAQWVARDGQLLERNSHPCKTVREQAAARLF